MVCQSAGWDWLEISPLDVHIDLEREKKQLLRKQMAAVMSSMWQAIMRQRQQLGEKATVTEVRTETTALP